jgi:hypothetical protein
MSAYSIGIRSRSRACSRQVALPNDSPGGGSGTGLARVTAGRPRRAARRYRSPGLLPARELQTLISDKKSKQLSQDLFSEKAFHFNNLCRQPRVPDSIVSANELQQE